MVLVTKGTKFANNSLVYLSFGMSWEELWRCIWKVSLLKTSLSMLCPLWHPTVGTKPTQCKCINLNDHLS